MRPGNERAERILDLARKAGVVSAAEVRRLGIHYEYLRRLHAEGRLVRVSRGLYALPDAEVTAHHSLALAAKAVPGGVICLLSAVSFHGLGTQAPHGVWMAVEKGSAQPRVKRPRMRILRFSGRAFSEGTKTHSVEGVPVRIYCAAKTVADCFKYRNKIGLDVPLEALREALRARKCTVDELWHYARICRVTTILRPYLEALV